MADENPEVRRPMSGKNKYIQLEVDGRPTVVLGSDRYHGYMAGDYLKERGVLFEFHSNVESYPVKKGDK